MPCANTGDATRGINQELAYVLEGCVCAKEIRRSECSGEIIFKSDTKTWF